ncbi:MAG: SRPBCC family protein [Thermoguttaceae bacterium]
MATETIELKPERRREPALESAGPAVQRRQPPTPPRQRNREPRTVRPQIAGPLSDAGLGWFSIGLGAAGLLFPRAISRWLVRRDHRRLLRAVGARELASGIGLLSGRQTAAWLWSRVAGDAMDLLLLGAASQSRRASAGRIAATTAVVAAAAAVDVMSAVQEEAGRRVHVRQSITTNVSPEAAYDFWRDLANIPRFMRHIRSVTPTGPRHSHWVATGVAGIRIEWDAELTEEQPNRLIAWRTLPGARIRSSGRVEFERAPDDRGAVVRVEMEYEPPLGSLGVTAARLLGREPAQQLHEDLRRLKQLLETGEIITTQGQPAGRPSGASWKYDSAARDDQTVADR